MSTATLDHPASLFDAPAHHGQTLEDLLSGVWAEIRSDHSAACPVCGSAMSPRHGAGPHPVVGRCNDCGSDLS